jgi:hypothetical protein
MAGSAYQPYAPLNVLKPVAGDLWIVDGPEIRMAFPGGSMPFPTRCTVVRLPDGGLWIHSPTELTTDLAASIERLGPVHHLIAPSSLHWWWVGDWKARWPDAVTWAAPRVRKKAAARFDGWDADLGDIAPAAWSGVIEQGLAHSLVTDEVVFFHTPSRTLILTDLIENFEPRRLGQPWRTLTRLFGASDPHGSAPYDMRLAFWPYRKRLRALIDRMLALHPRRVILAHGRGYADDAEAELRRAFGWLR